MALPVASTFFKSLASSFFSSLPGETVLLSLGLLIGYIYSKDDPGGAAAEDAAHVRRVKDGDKDGYVFLFKKYSEPLYRYCYVFLSRRKEPQEDAQDAMRDAFMKCLAHIRALREDGAFFRYLKTAAYHECLDRLRVKQADADPSVLAGEEADTEVMEGVAGLVERRTPRDAALVHEIRGDVKKAVSALRDNYGKAVVLVHFMGYSYEEAAEIMGAGVKDIRNWVHRGMVKLGEVLKDYRGSFS